MKKILFISPYFIPALGYGGPPKINSDLAKYLINKKYYVEVWTTDVLDGHKRCVLLNENINRVKVVRFKNISNWLAWNFKFFIPIKYSRYAKQNIIKFDYVSINNLKNIIHNIKLLDVTIPNHKRLYVIEEIDCANKQVLINRNTNKIKVFILMLI